MLLPIVKKNIVVVVCFQITRRVILCDHIILRVFVHTMPFKAGLGSYNTSKLNISDTSSDDNSDYYVEVNSNSTHAHAAIKNQKNPTKKNYPFANSTKRSPHESLYTPKRKKQTPKHIKQSQKWNKPTVIGKLLTC